MKLRPAAIAAVFPLAMIACSGSGGVEIPPASDEINAGAPIDHPHSGDPVLPGDGGGADASVTTDSGSKDGGTDAHPDAGPVSCNACLSAPAPAGCKAEQDACMTHATCKLLDACLDACSTTACRNGCFTQYPDPEAKARNGALYKCQCTTTCATACKVECG